MTFATGKSSSHRVASPSPLRRIQVTAVAALGTIAAASLVFPAPLAACDTPVYRYAMYNWTPFEYRVYYLHDGKSDTAGDAANRALVELIESGSPSPNLEFLPLKVAADDASESLPREVQSWWTDHATWDLPVHLVTSPHGEVIFAGRLEAADVQALVDSPARQQVAELLDLGHTGVLLLLTAGNDSADARAESEIEKVIHRAATGGITPFTLQGAEQVESIHVEDLSPSREQQMLDVAMVKVSRSDPAETWLVRSLVAIERDLAEINEPMVFAIYGRARAMEPYVGRGVTADNLARCVSFIAGACSCEVKEQNPGMDLLVRWDWESTAAVMAAEAGEEEGNEAFLTVEELLPSIVGAPNGAIEPAEDSAALASSPNVRSVGSGAIAAAGVAADTGAARAVRKSGGDVSSDERPAGDAFGRQLLRRLGLGVGVAAAVLLLVSIFIFRLRPAG